VGSSSPGFSLLEALIALAIVTSGVVTLAGLAVQVVDSVARSRRHLASAVLADAYLAARLARPLAPTPLDCLQRDVAGCHDVLDADGGLASGAAPAFVRRWRIAAVPGAPSVVFTLAVCVVPIEGRRVGGIAPGACVMRVVSEVLP
jgi:type II secretory pathway pseudopilin PulG